MTARNAVQRFEWIPIVVLMIGLWAPGMDAKNLLGQEQRSAQKGRQFRGHVVDEQGNAMPGVIVKANSGLQSLSVTTDENGRFELNWPDQHVSYLHALTDDRSLQGTFSVFAGHRDYAFDDLPEDIEVVLKPARTITVSVVDEQQRPVDDAWAMVMADYLEVAESTTDSNGQATLVGPSDITWQYVAAGEPTIGLDYFGFHHPDRPRDNAHQLEQNHIGPVTLTLNGASPVTLRVVDEQEQPLSNVPVYLWYVEKPARGEIFNASGYHRFHTVTGEDGRAVFDVVPADNTAVLTFHVASENYWSPERPTFDPKAPVDEVIARMERLVPVEGVVTSSDGRPAAGAEVRIAGSGLQFDDFRTTVLTDDHGKFTARVYPNQYYAVRAMLSDAVSPVAAAIIRTESPPEPIQLTLEKGTCLHGRLTRPDGEGIPQGHIALYQKDAAPDYLKLPKEGQLPNPKDSRKHIAPLIVRTFQTDGEGHYEICVGPGTYYMFASVPNHEQVEIAPFNITRQEAFEINLRARKPLLVMQGRVVLAQNPSEGIGNVTINGVPMEHQGRHFNAVTDADGRFEVTRSPVMTMIQARSEDGTLAGIVRSNADDTELTIEIGPLGSAKGRLVDAQGKPLVDQVLQYGIHLQRGMTFSNHFGGQVKTNESGEFQIDGIVTGWTYELQLALELDADGNVRSLRRIGAIELSKPDLFEMGDVYTNQ